MTVANGFNRVEGEAVSALRRCAANIVRAVSLLGRPVRVHARLHLLSPRVAIAAIVATTAFLFLMMAIDAAAIRGVSHFPRWIVSAFDDITDFGKSGWFLWPLGLLFIALAALPPVLTPFSQRILATIMVRVGFLFTAIAVPSLFVTIIKRMIGRARPMVGGSLDPYLFSPFAWSRGLCWPAIRSCHDGIRCARRRWYAVAARPHGPIDLCAVDCDESGDGDRALSDRRARRRTGRDSRRGNGEALFRAAQTWFCYRGKRYNPPISRTLAQAH